MSTLSAAEAADLLKISPKRVRELARAGKLPARRVGRKWLFPRAELSAMVGAEVAAGAESGQVADAAGPAMGARGFEISARNQLRGRITSVRIDGVMAEVRIALGDQELVSIITRASAERLHLRVGDEALAVIKSTEVMLGRASW